MRARFQYLTTALTLSLATMATSVSAADLALIISNSDYDALQGERRITREHSDTVAAFRAQGYEVIEGVDLTRLEMQALVQRVDSVIDELQSIVVLCSTNIVTDGAQTWILPTDISGDSRTEVAFGAPTLDLLLSLAARKPGHGSVFLGVADVDSSRGSTLQSGVGDGGIPQGVLLVSGPPEKISDLLQDDLLGRDRTLAEGLSGASGVTVDGFVSPDIGLQLSQSEAASPSGNWVDFVAEQTLWAVADRSNNPDDFAEYLRRFPDGLFADAARDRLAEVTAPVITAPTPESIEADLNLSRDERRAVQANLTVLGFDTRGVDGILGRGSRAAITAWQESQHLEGTGYLTGQQLLQLQRLADARRAVLEAADRRYWNASGVSGRKEDLETYLAKYPNGVFSDQAREDLAEIDAAARTRADNDAWSQAVSGGTADAYRAYLVQFPEGIYASIAVQRIEALDPGSSTDPDEEAAKAQEDRLQLNTATRLLIEGRLKSSGFNPGIVDGNFDSRTRAAIRDYQAARGISPTGYIDPATVRSLLLG